MILTGMELLKAGHLSQIKAMQSGMTLEQQTAEEKLSRAKNFFEAAKADLVASL